MIVTRPALRPLAALLLFLIAGLPQRALALPTMIRLGYTECGACHLSPQGGGPLNEYGRGIDRAQSLRGGDYVPPIDDLTRALTFRGRTTQDLRTILQEQTSHAAGNAVQARFWPRAIYRNVTELGNGFSASAVVTGAVRVLGHSARCSSTIKSVVLRPSTAHWLTTVVGQPAIKKAQASPIMPSPAPTLPRAVSQAESTASSAFSFRFIISRASSKPSSALGPRGGASSNCE